MKKLHFIFLFIFFIPALSFSFGLFNTGFWKKNSENDSNINLLLHGDGSGTFIVDSSGRNHTVTSVNGATQSTVQSKFGGSSIYFDGTDDYLSIPYSDDWNFGNANYTIDLWLQVNANVEHEIFNQHIANGTRMIFRVNPRDSQVIFQVENNSSTLVNVSANSHSVSQGVWYHYAIIRSVNITTIYENGIAIASATGNYTYPNYNVPLWIGKTGFGASNLTGYIDELRISKGVARWTSNFTPPAYPAGMSGLACPTNYIRVPALSGYTTSDFCVAKYEMKSNGGAKSEAAGFPWVSIARGTDDTTAGSAWKACKDIGVGYDLISNDDWQTIARNIADQNVNWSNGSAVNGTTGQLNRGHSDNVPANSLAASTDDNDGCSGTGQTCSSTTWDSQRRTHTLSNGNVIWDFAGNVWEWVQDNNSSSQGTDGYISTFIDSRQANYGNDTFCSSSGSDPYCGMGHGWTSYAAGAVYRGGYWGSSVATGVFTASFDRAPTVTAASLGFRCVHVPNANTKLLLHGDGSGVSFTDSSVFKHSINVNGGATQSTAQSKFGGSSAVLNGAGMYLTIGDSTDWDFGTGDFTIDFWVYITSFPASGANQMIVYNAGQILIGYQNYLDKRWVLAIGGSDIIVGGNSISLNTWYHVAAARSSGTVKLFINGTSIGTVTNTASIDSAGSLYIGNNPNGTDHNVSGYMDEVRIVKGQALWTSNFTPPTKSYNSH